MNPVSGRRGMLPELQQIGHLLENAGGTIDCFVTSGVGHATEIAAQLPDDIDAVLIVGGDGTVCEVVNGLIGKSIPIVILDGTACGLTMISGTIPFSVKGISS